MKFLAHAQILALLTVGISAARANDPKHHEAAKSHAEPAAHGAPKDAHENADDKFGVKPTANLSAAQKLSEKVTCEKLPQKSDSDLWDLAECFYKIGVNEETIQVLRSISQKNPKDLDAYFTASWLLWQEGRNRGGTTERKFLQDALAELQKARLLNPTHWEVDTELGDFYFLRLDQPEKAYPEYLRARQHNDGDYARNVPKAENGRKASIEDRIARAAERLDRAGEAVDASCRALYFDPDDPSAETRIKRLGGSCVRKNVQDPRASSDSGNEPGKPTEPDAK